MKLDGVKDNITIVNDDGDVLVVITEDEIITYQGYEVIFDVGVED